MKIKTEIKIEIKLKNTIEKGLGRKNCGKGFGYFRANYSCLLLRQAFLLFFTTLIYLNFSKLRIPKTPKIPVDVTSSWRHQQLTFQLTFQLTSTKLLSSLNFQLEFSACRRVQGMNIVVWWILWIIKEGYY